MFRVLAFRRGLTGAAGEAAAAWDWWRFGAAEMAVKTEAFGWAVLRFGWQGRPKRLGGKVLLGASDPKMASTASALIARDGPCSCDFAETFSKRICE